MSEDTDFKPDQLEAAGALGGSPDHGYVYPTDPLVQANLEHWRDLKLGVIIHWGLYTSIGQAGSWSLYRGHLGDFTDPPADFQGTDADYHQWYFNQRHVMDGSNFDPEQWASLCAGAGMKYMVFTTKHHDGFAMFNTQYSNLKVTAEDCPVRRDIFDEVTTAFRSHGLETGVYFSKADWARPDYWDLSRPLLGRFANYDSQENPIRWSRFVQFTHDQIRELLSNYGPMNVLWLDAGWVRGPREDIDIDGLAEMARKIQPGILVVDREVHGPQENYRTPEQEIPDHYLDYPWESCVTWTKSWCSTQIDEPAKPTWEIVANLLHIVGRGGNYLIGFGPDASGALSKYLVQGLQELGAWMETHGEGIYGTRGMANPPVITQTAGDPHDWMMVTQGDHHYLYGVPEAGQTSSVKLEIGMPIREAHVLGGGDARVVPGQSLEAGADAEAENQDGSVTGLVTALELDAPGDMGYVVRLD